MTNFLPLVLLIVVLLEGTHAALVQAIRSKRSELLDELGRTGPGYYFFGLFAFEPAYRRFLTSGRLRLALAGHTDLIRLAKAELFFWYFFLVSIVFAMLTG